MGGVGWVVVGGLLLLGVAGCSGCRIGGGGVGGPGGSAPSGRGGGGGARCVHTRVLALWAMVVLGGARWRWVALVAAGWGLRVEGIVDGLLGR